MADLTVNITETITLNGQTQAESYNQTIPGINHIDIRNLNCPYGALINTNNALSSSISTPPTGAAGIYTSVSTTTNNSGAGATFTVSMSSATSVDSIIVVSPGANYASGDIITISSGSLGGVASPTGSNLVITLTNDDITGVKTNLFNLSNLPGAGTFATESFQYARITNLSSITPVKLIVSSSSETIDFLVSTDSSFFLSTSKIVTGSSFNNFNFNDIQTITVQPSSSAAQIEYYIATT
jgi:hypothetical protein